MSKRADATLSLSLVLIVVLNIMYIHIMNPSILSPLVCVCVSVLGGSNCGMLKSDSDSAWVLNLQW